MPPADWCVREEKSVVLDRTSRPESNILVARGSLNLYRYNDPTAAEAVLIIEVSDSSYIEDRSEKFFRYAAAKIPTYVILNIPSRRFVVFTKPYGRGEKARYRESATFDEASEMPVVIGVAEVGIISVRDVPP